MNTERPRQSTLAASREAATSPRRKPGSIRLPPDRPAAAPLPELDPARSKSVEAVEQEVQQIVDALEARERARREQRNRNGR